MERLIGTIKLMDWRDWLVKISVLVIVALAAHALGCREGYAVAHDKARQEEAGRTAQAVQQQVDADTKVLATERALRDSDRKSFDTYRKEQANALAEKDRFIARLRTGAERLRVPVVGAVCPAAQDPGGSAAARAGGEGYAELSGDGAQFLVDLLERGDVAIRKHAEVVDRYNRLLQACTGAGATSQVDTSTN